MPTWGLGNACENAGVQKGSFYHFFPSKTRSGTSVIENSRMTGANGFGSRAFDPRCADGADRLLIDAAYFWQKSIKEVHGRMQGCIFGNLTLEVSTQDDILRAKLLAIFTRAKFASRTHSTRPLPNGDIAPLDTSLKRLKPCWPISKA